MWLWKRPHLAINPGERKRSILSKNNACHGYTGIDCTITRVVRVNRVMLSFLPHAHFTSFRACPSQADSWYMAAARPLDLRIVPQHCTNTTYNISEAQRNRSSSQKVISILPLSFFVDTHGTNYYNFRGWSSQKFVGSRKKSENYL